MKFRKLPPPSTIMPILLVLVFVFNINKVFGQNWDTGTNNSIHNINTGNVGIGGNFEPSKKLHIKKSGSDIGLRLQLINDGSWSKCNIGATDYYIWDIINEKNKFLFKSKHQYCSIISEYSTKMALTEKGQLALGTETPLSSAIMQLESTDKGLLLPRLTTAQKNAIISPAIGLILFLKQIMN